MTRTGRRLIEDFLLPALNEQKYGELLKWVDCEKCHFSIRWSHKNAAKWSLEDTAVFQDWDRLKGHYHPELKGYYMQAKQRFRAALYKLNSVRRLPCDDKHVKKYQLIMDHDKRRDFLARSKVRTPKKEDNQKSIPTSVIRKNTSYIEKPKDVYSNPPISPPSPSSSSKSEMSDKEELEQCLFEYTRAQRKQMMLSNNSKQYMYTSDESPTKETSDSSVLRENTFVQRTPHVPTQPVPVYSSSIRHVYDSSQKRFESPHVLLVQTYNDLSEEDEPEIKEESVDFEMEYIISEQTTEIALNLSVKSEESDNFSSSMKSEDGDSFSSPVKSGNSDASSSPVKSEDSETVSR